MALIRRPFRPPAEPPGTQHAITRFIGYAVGSREITFEEVVRLLNNGTSRLSVTISYRLRGSPCEIRGLAVEVDQSGILRVCGTNGSGVIALVRNQGSRLYGEFTYDSTGRPHGEIR